MVWLANTPLHPERAVLVRSWLGASETARYAQIVSMAKQEEYLASRFLLRRALTVRFGGKPIVWNVEEQVKAAPIVTNSPSECHVSISHSGDRVAVALDVYPLGVDVERQRVIPSLENIARRVFTSSQCHQLSEVCGQAQQDLFFRLWTAKEARYKAQSQAGKQSLFFTNQEEASPFPVQYFQSGRYAIAVASQCLDESWKMIQLDYSVPLDDASA